MDLMPFLKTKKPKGKEKPCSGCGKKMAACSCKKSGGK